MTRPRAIALLAVVLALVITVVTALSRRPAPPRGLPAAANPGGYVASDVARLGATGRPQLVEVFHYG